MTLSKNPILVGKKEVPPAEFWSGAPGRDAVTPLQYLDWLALFRRNSRVFPIFAASTKEDGPEENDPSETIGCTANSSFAPRKFTSDFLFLNVSKRPEFAPAFAVDPQGLHPSAGR